MNTKIDTALTYITSLTLEDLSNLVDRLEKIYGTDVELGSFNKEIQVAEKLAKKEENSEKTITLKEQTSFTLVLENVITEKKVILLKSLRTILNLGLKESKDFVDNLPKIVKENISKEEATKLADELKQLGATVTIK